MKPKIEQFPANNPNPVLSVGKDLTVLYSNAAGEPLLHEWGVKIGGKLPSSIADLIKRAICRNSPEKIEVRVGERIYLVAFYPSLEEDGVNIYGFDISDQRELEGKSRENEAQEKSNLELAKIIDTQAVQSLMNDFNKLVHIPMGLTDLKGNVLVNAGWQEICTKFHRVNPEACKHCVESDINLSTGVAPGEYKLYKCKNNMWDVVTPIMVEGQHVGNILSGQFFFDDEPLDYELFRSQARQYGFNEEEYIAALEKVPRLSREAVDTGMAFFMTFANMISQLSYSNIKLSQSLVERDALVDALQENRKDFDRAQAVGNIGSWRLDVCKNELTWSDENHCIFGIPKGTPLTYEIFLSTVYPDDRKYVDKEWKKGLAGEPYDIDHRIIADGKVKWVREKAYLEFNNNGVLLGGFGITQDITERKKADEALKKAHDSLEEKVKERTTELEEAYYLLKESEKGLAEAQKTAHIGNWDWNLVTGEMYWSNEMHRIFGCTPRKLCSSFNDVLSHTHPDDREYVNNTVKRALKGKPFDIDHRIISADEEERVVHAQGEVTFDEKNTPIRMRGTVQDITERKRAEEKIQSLANIVESSKDAIITQSFGIITSWNKGAEQVYGYSAKEILAKPVSILEPDSLKGEIKQLDEMVKQGEEIHNYETSRLRKDGTIINVSITLSPIFDASGKLTAISAIARDISERKRAEDAIAKIETARKKEIHHRIKNNLQVISSLLDLQAEKFKSRKDIKNSEVLEAFRESQGRVISMALIHEELHEGGGDNEVDFSPYLEKLVGNLFQTYRFRNTDISLNMNLVENLFFDMDTAIPLGMIVNELVSNSLKHAFPERDKGEIQIKLYRDENEDCKSNIFILIVSDNGIGIPENLEIEDLDSLGMQLVTTLVDQLDGEFELKRNNGTEFTTRFAVIEKNNQVTAPALQQSI